MRWRVAPHAKLTWHSLNGESHSLNADVLANGEPQDSGGGLEGEAEEEDVVARATSSGLAGNRATAQDAVLQAQATEGRGKGGAGGAQCSECSAASTSEGGVNEGGAGARHCEQWRAPAPPLRMQCCKHKRRRRGKGGGGAMLRMVQAAVTTGACSGTQGCGLQQEPTAKEKQHCHQSLRSMEHGSWRSRRTCLLSGSAPDEHDRADDDNQRSGNGDDQRCVRRKPKELRRSGGHSVEDRGHGGSVVRPSPAVPQRGGGIQAFPSITPENQRAATRRKADQTPFPLIRGDPGAKLPRRTKTPGPGSCARFRRMMMETARSESRDEPPT